MFLLNKILLGAVCANILLLNTCKSTYISLKVQREIAVPGRDIFLRILITLIYLLTFVNITYI